MKKLILSTAVAIVAAGSAYAASDVAQGEKDFRKCKSCHSITSPEGEKIVKGGRTGPNLWGVVGRVAGTEADFTRYGDSMTALGESGFVWDEEMIAAYVPNATDFLVEHVGEGAKTAGMTPQKVGDPTDVAAYLAQFVAPE